ncbi:hypothetical protein EXIGLDRAFT_430274 [Exidia glandulosa HHB12029]|uniref:Uncharacterized protein n=1 Tax=Exidia glandulosa HHB12029 TaxID=1314781 RepID=A0A165BAZ2_EXIGL|nr:hypothetical protein EXIGLDRAFT_430274 [Exidia glandulosa HHB12029]
MHDSHRWPVHASSFAARPFLSSMHYPYRVISFASSQGPFSTPSPIHPPLSSSHLALVHPYSRPRLYFTSFSPHFRQSCCICTAFASSFILPLHPFILVVFPRCCVVVFAVRCVMLLLRYVCSFFSPWCWATEARPFRLCVIHLAFDIRVVLPSLSC